MKINIKDVALKGLKLALKPLTTIGIALLIGAIIIIASGESPIDAYGALFVGSFGNLNAFLNTLSKATPLIFTGLAAAIASTAGVFNIGIEGQLYMGALGAAVCGVQLSFLPSFILLPLCLIVAMICAMVWAIIPGLLNSKLDINIFIMFFMLNNVALLLTEFLANGPFKGDLPEAATGKLPEGAMLARFSIFSDLNMGIVIALVLIAATWFILKKTRLGYECQALGHNRTFSEYIGLRAGKRALIVLMVSAMVAGLAGAEQTMGSLGRFYAGFSDNLGFTGLSIGLLAGNNPIGIVIFAIFFGMLRNGAIFMSISTGISSDIIDVLQSLMIIMISAEFVWRVSKRKPKATQKAEV